MSQSNMRFFKVDPETNKLHEQPLFHVVEEKPERNVDLTVEDVDFLKQRGYDLGGSKGQGKTRSAFSAMQRQGDVVKPRVLEIPFLEVDSESVRTEMNRSKPDPDYGEVAVSNQISHPNVVEVIDSFILPSGRRVNVEPDYGGTDLEKIIKSIGPLQNQKRFGAIAEQILAGMAYLNGKKRILHRDLKPSNILLTEEGEIKIRDLQTAKRIEEIRTVSMPTFGERHLPNLVF